MLEEFNEEIKNRPEDKMVDATGDSRIFQYSQGELLSKLRGINQMSEQETYELLKKEYSGILSDIFKRNSKDYRFLLDSPRFITIMTQIVNEVEMLYDERVHCNSFIYKYIVYVESEENSYIKKLLFLLGEALNKNTVRSLLGCELDEKLAIFLAVAAKSSFKPSVNIKRINFTIATALPSVMDTRRIIKIYEVLFTHVTELITTTLFDKDIINAQGEWVTKEILSVDNRITYAVMVILESMVPIEITRCLISIAESYKMHYGYAPNNCRISFASLDKKVFNKISIIVAQLEGDGYIFP